MLVVLIGQDNGEHPFTHLSIHLFIYPSYKTTGVMVSLDPIPGSTWHKMGQLDWDTRTSQDAYTQYRDIHLSNFMFLNWERKSNFPWRQRVQPHREHALCPHLHMHLYIISRFHSFGNNFIQSGLRANYTWEIKKKNTLKSKTED